MIALRLLRDGAVVRETVFRELPVTLGRGPECDFPILDASVSRVHARLDRDPSGTLVLRDLGSRNGLHVGPRRVESTAVAGRLQCLVGAAEVEIEASAGEITQEIRLHDWRRYERRRGPRDYLRYTLVGVLGWLAALTLEPAFWSPWEKGRGTALLGNVLGALVALPLLSTLLLVLLKAFGRRLRAADALETLSRVVWLLPSSGVLTFLAYYVLSSGGFAVVRGLLATAAAAWAAVSIAAVRRPGPSRLFRTLWAAAVVGIAAGLTLTARLTAQHGGQPDLDFHVQVPLSGWAGRTESLDAYLAHLTARAEEAATQAATQRAKEE